MKASDRYSQILHSYQQALRVESITLSSYCKHHHIYYRGLRKWMDRNCITVKQLKSNLSSAPVPEKESSKILHSSEQQIYPLSFPSANTRKKRIEENVLPCIKGVSITFPDGVIVCIKEISRQDLTAFVVSYNTP